MEIINNKGKILGIINIIDFIIIFLVILMGVIFYKYVIMLDWEKYNFGELSYEIVERTIVLEMLISPENSILLNNVVPGAKEIYQRQTQGIIIDRQIIEFNTNNLNLTTILIKIKSNLTKINNDLYYNIDGPSQQLIKLNDNFIFNSEKIKLEGKVINIE